MSDITVKALTPIKYGTTADDIKLYTEGETFVCSEREAKQLLEAGAVEVSDGDKKTLDAEPTTDASYTSDSDTSIAADNTISANPNLVTSQPVSLTPTPEQIAQDLASVESPAPDETPKNVQLS